MQYTASMQMEIEVKAQVDNHDQLFDNLQARGCVFSEPKTQDDTVYVARVGSYEEFLDNDVFLRVRVQSDGSVILTAKKPIRKSGEVLVKYEHEVRVDSAEEARGILALMGLQEAIRVVKKRQTGECEGYHVCLDVVEDLGMFIELEKMGEKSEADTIQADMWRFLESLNISPDSRVTKGYDVLLWEKKDGMRA